MNKGIKKILLIMLICILIIIMIGNLSIASTTKEEIKQQIQKEVKNIDTNNITTEDILETYDELTKKYSNNEIADIIEENKEEIKQQGISEEIIDVGTNFLKTTDTESVRDIIENDIDLNNIQQKLESGYTPNQVLQSIVEETPTDKKVTIATKLLLANNVVKNVLMILIFLFIYETILRWIIYNKSGKHGWAAIIPLYRQIVMYKVCRLSPWLMLLWFVPIFGWIAMFIIAIMKRFCLSREFGRGALFGFGLLFLPIIFKSILAFNPNIKYIQDRK